MRREIRGKEIDALSGVAMSRGEAAVPGSATATSILCDGICNLWSEPFILTTIFHRTASGVVACVHDVCDICLRLHSKEPGEPHLRLRNCRLPGERPAWREPREPSPFGRENC